jgi:ParB-like chromosome segregation protein Spo0J
VAHGFLGAIVVDENDTILAGHGRLEAAKLLGLTSVPTLQVDGLTGAQKRTFALADNKIGENAGWNRELLVRELGRARRAAPAPCRHFGDGI